MILAANGVPILTFTVSRKYEEISVSHHKLCELTLYTAVVTTDIICLNGY